MSTRKFEYININNDKVRVISYNILSHIQLNIFKKHQISCKKNCLLWEFRFNLLKKEIINLKPDIITLQEVDNNIFPILLKYFSTFGFIGYFNKSSQSYGNCIMFKKDKFILLKKSSIDYNKYSKLFLKKKKLNHFLDKIDRRFCSLVLKLKYKKNNKDIFVTTVHLDSNIYYEDIKNFQAYIVLKYIDKISANHTIPIILTGDFNCLPISSTYKGITTGISHNYFYMEDIDYPEPFLKTPKQFTKNKLFSCYKKVFKREPTFTNYSYNFKETTDYIFVNSKIKILGALKEINKDNLSKFKSLPNNQYQSDHFIQAADIYIK